MAASLFMDKTTQHVSNHFFCLKLNHHFNLLSAAGNTLARHKFLICQIQELQITQTINLMTDWDELCQFFVQYFHMVILTFICVACSGDIRINAEDQFGLPH